MNGHSSLFRPWLTAVLGLILATLSAQVPAPELRCTRSEAGQEILTWANVDVDDCGAYTATEIYRASTAAGPYTLLAALTDRSITEYADDNPNGQRLYYFLRYAYECDATPLTSDTLDSFIPATPPIDFVSVEDGDLIVHWQPSASPEVNRYVVYSVTDTSIRVLDTVGNVQSYRIDGPFPDGVSARRYRVAALDACGNDSPQSAIVSPYTLTGSGGQDCQSAIRFDPFLAPLETELFGDADSVRLYVSSNGGPYSLAGESLLAARDLPVYDGGNAGERLCFYAEVDFAARTANLRTDTFCVTLTIFQPVRPFDLFGVERNGGGVMRLGYGSAGPQPDDYQTTLQVATPSDTLSYPLTTPLFPGDGVRTDGGVELNPGDSVRLLLTDNCGRTAATNFVSPVWLSLRRGAGDAVVLNWTAPQNELPGELTYTVYRVTDDSTEVVVASGVSDLEFLDAAPGGGADCYRVEAVFTPPDGRGPYVFSSEVQCILEFTRVYLPSAFSPVAREAANRTFRPYFNSRLGISDYSLRVYDRWGGLRFESNDPTEGWTGEDAPGGSYLYVLVYTGATGNISQERGVVHLVR